MVFSAGAHVAIGQLHRTAAVYRDIAQRLGKQEHTEVMHQALTKAAGNSWDSPAGRAYQYGVEGLRPPITVAETATTVMMAQAAAVAQQLTEAAELATQVSTAVRGIHMMLTPGVEEMAQGAVLLAGRANDALESGPDFMRFVMENDGVLRSLQSGLNRLGR